MPAPARCARLAVPLDYAHPGGRTITLALNEIPATAPAGQRLGPLLVNPGGPGGSGLRLALYVAGVLPRDVASQYDIIGFDPRGVGDSVPALHCDPSFFSGVRPAYEPSQQGLRAGDGQPGEGVRGRLRAPVRLASAAHDHRGQRA